MSDSTKLYEGENPLLVSIFTALEPEVHEFVQLKSKVTAAGSDRAAAVKSLMEESEDPEMVKLRTAIQKAQDKLKSLAETKAAETTMSEEELSAAQELLSASRNKIQGVVKNTAGLAESMGLTEEVSSALEKVSNALGKRVSSGGGQTGSGLPRVPVEVFVKGGQLNQWFNSFSAVATALKTDVETLQKAFADAAGVAHADIKSVTKEVDFSLTLNDEVYQFHTKRKETQRPGRKPKSAESASE